MSLILPASCEKDERNIQTSSNSHFPKISVITPSYNQSDFLEACIESVLGQNYPNLEYIIMDGGSSDGTIDIIKRYSRFLTFWRSQPDGGQYEAINEGFRRSTGEIMTWLNSDDMFHPNAFSTVAYVLLEHPDVKWVMGRPNGFDEYGHQSWIYDYLPLWNREKYLRKQYREPYIQQEGTFWRRSLWEKSGANICRYFDLAGDLELWARFFRHAELYSVDTLLAGFRQHSHQKTASLIERYNEEAEAILEREQILFEQSSDKTLFPPPMPLLPGESSSSKLQNFKYYPPNIQGIEGDSKQDAYLVSAIVSLYNSEQFIRGCLEDLVSQTLYAQGRLEIIVVDSASQQNEAALVRELQSNYNNIRYVRTEERETIYASWNRGIALSRGRYITNANSDDRHRIDAFELMSQIMESRPAVDLVYADVLITETPNETFGRHTLSGRYAWYDWDRNLLLHKGCFIGPQPMWRRSLHDLYGGFDPSYVTSGDYEFWLRISQTSDFFHIRQPLGLYLAHPESIEHQNEDQKRIENRKILNLYQQSAKEGRIKGLIPLEQIRTLATKNLIGSRGAAAPLIEEYVRSVEYQLLDSQEWYSNRRSVENMPAEESSLRLEVLSTAIQKARLLFQRGEVDDALSMLLNQGIRAASSSPVVYFELAEILMAAGRYDDALQVLPEMPQAADVCRVKEIEAICYAAIGEDEAALEAVKLAPERPRVLVVRGTLAARCGDLAQAEKLFKLAVDRDPSCGSAWFSLGMLLWGNGDQEGAYQAVRKAVLVEPLNGEAVKILRDMAERLGGSTTLPLQTNSHLGDALTVISASAQLYPDCCNLARHRAELLVQCGRDAEAMNACETFLTCFGADAELLSLALGLRQQIGSYDRLTEAGAQSVSLCMIVKNEEKCLAGCLACLKPVVDEMIIVDTGSSDRTVDIAVAFGAKVFDFTWSGDFSAARNHSLSSALGRWILVMDADELLSERDFTRLQQLLHGSSEKLVAWSVVTRNYTNRAESEGWHANDGEYPEHERGDGWYPSKKVRLFPALKTVRFRGDIHEMVEADLRALGIPVEQANLVVHHFGELTDNDRREKQLRYYNMGKQKLLERPDDVVAALELALQAGELELFDEALELWDNLLLRGVTSLDVYFNRSYVLMGLGRFDEASGMAIKALEMDPDHKESAYNYGICLLNLGRSEQAEIFVALESAKHPDYPLLMSLLCVLQLCAENFSSAERISEKLRAANYAISDYIKARAVALEQFGHPAIASQLRQAAVTVGVQ